MVLFPGCPCCGNCQMPFPAKITIELSNVVGVAEYRAFTQSEVVKSGQQFDYTISYLFNPPPVAGVYELPKNPALTSRGEAKYLYEDSHIRLEVIIGPISNVRRVIDLVVYTKQGVRQKIMQGAGAVVSQSDLESDGWDNDCKSTQWITIDTNIGQDNNVYPVCSSFYSLYLGINRFGQDCTFTSGAFRTFFETIGNLSWSAPNDGGAWDFSYLYGHAFGVPVPPVPVYPWRLSGQFVLPVGQKRFGGIYQTQQFWQPEAGSFVNTDADYSFDVTSIRLTHDDGSIVEVPYR